MKKNALPKILKTILKIFLVCIVVAGMGTAYISGKIYKKNIVCKGLEASVVDSLHSRFIQADDVAGLILNKYGEFEGIPCNKINLAAIENIIDSQDAVKKSEVYFNRDGNLNVIIDQREPILRVQMGANGFYVDKEHILFPLQKQYTANVIVMDGAMPFSWENYKNKDFSGKMQQEWLDGAVELAVKLQENPLWKKKVSQFHCSSRYGIIVIPKEGHEKFVFGFPDNLDAKISRMEKYYTHIKPVKKDKDYIRIDLRYDGQIICK